MSAQHPAERQVFTPSQLNAFARELLEGTFPLIWVEGELSNVSRPSSGHLYFVLKDERAQIRCALFKPKSQWLRFRPADGVRVLARARVTLYEARGEYQLVVEHLEEAGEGALRRAFEALKAKLAAEGLFEAQRKRALPRFVRRLALLTSPSGAAAHDVLSILRRRFPLIEVELLPVPVQGDTAANLIVRMLRRADASERYDILLIARGGGSLEDLQAFNDETLARAIATAQTPVVSAVGHEVDFSIADFVADLRAATPSAAAELLVPDRNDLSALLHRRHAQIVMAWRRAFESRAQRLDQLHRRLTAQRPAARLERGRERLLGLRRGLQVQIASKLHRQRDRHHHLGRRLDARHPRLRLAELRARLALAIQRQRTTAARALERRSLHLRALGRALNAVSPLATLERGYAIVRDPQHGRLVRRAASLEAGQALVLRFADGESDVRVEHVRNDPE